MCKKTLFITRLIHNKINLFLLESMYADMYLSKINEIMPISWN